MEIKVNDSNKQLVPEYKNYSGIGNFKVVGVNLSLSELDLLGYPYQTEPNYEATFGDDKFFKVVFYVKNEQFGIASRVEFLINDLDIKPAQSGKHKFINNLGQTTYADSKDSVPDWFNTSGLRVAKNGEPELIDFIINWGNIKTFVSKKEKEAGVKPDEIYLDFVALAKGNLVEMNQVFNAAKANEVKLFVYVVESKGKWYMSIYNKYFSRASSTIKDFIEYLAKQIKAGYAPKGQYFIGDLKEFTPNVGGAPMPDPDQKPKEEVPF